MYEDMTNVFRRIANKDVGSSNYFTRDTHCLLRRPFVGPQVRHSPYSAVYIDQFQLLYYKKFFSVFFSPLKATGDEAGTLTCAYNLVCDLVQILYSLQPDKQTLGRINKTEKQTFYKINKQTFLINGKTLPFRLRSSINKRTLLKKWTNRRVAPKKEANISR